MNRRSVIALGVVCALLAAVVGGAAHLIEVDRSRLYERFAAERRLQVEEAAELTRSDLDGVAVMLHVADNLLRSSDDAQVHVRELEALIAATDQFRTMRVFDANGEPSMSISNPRLKQQAAGADLENEMRLTSVRSLSRAGELELSPPIPTPDGRSLRVYALAPSASGRSHLGAIAVLVDSDRQFSQLGVLSADPTVHILLLGPRGRPTPSSDARLAAVASAPDPKEQPVFVELLEAVRGGQSGTKWISPAETVTLGLGDADVFAAYTPLRTTSLGRWSLATFSSTSELQAAQLSVAERLAGAAAAVAALVIGFAIFVIITARREAVARERILHAERLARLHERTAMTLDHIPAGVMSLDADKRLISANLVVRQRMSPGTLTPCTLARALPGAPTSTVVRLERLIDAAILSESVHSLHGERLALFGSEGQYSIHAVPLLEAFDETRSLLVVEDVSEVRSLESQLLRAEKLATIGVLAAGLAHEVGTPLGIVRSRAEYVLGKLGSGHSQARGVTVIIDQIDRVTRTVRRMLDFSRVQPAAVRPVALPQIATWLGDVLHYETARRQLKLEVAVPVSLPLVSADPDQLQQLLLNLAMNACDACSAGGCVRLSAEQTATAAGWACVKIEVADDGCGIAADHRPGIFDPFFTTKKRGQGTGLGLTVAAQIARNHGAQIELDSEVGRGTRVMVFWPLATEKMEVPHEHVS